MIDGTPRIDAMFSPIFGFGGYLSILFPKIYSNNFPEFIKIVQTWALLKIL